MSSDCREIDAAIHPASPQILLAPSSGRVNPVILAALEGLAAEVTRIDDPGVVSDRIADRCPDLVIAPASVGREYLTGWRTELEKARSGRLIVMSDQPSIEEATMAIRVGAIDYLSEPLSISDAGERLRIALSAVARERRRTERIERLKGVCQRINTARLDMTNQMDTLCNDLVSAYQDLTEQIAHVTTVTEFTAVIRQELDIEELLRSALEYFLRRIGPMNAAIFLPNSADEYTLGAYVNYDCPAGNPDVLLEHLGDVVAPRMLEETDVLEFRNEEELAEWIGDDAAWIADSHVIAFSCRNDEELLAIVLLFRDVNTPFPDDMRSLMGSLSQIFASQLAHVIHVHHRHLPDEGFGDLDYPDEGGGLAA